MFRANASLLPVFLFLLTFAGRISGADAKESEGQSSTKVEDVAGRKNKVVGDIDKEITNK